MSAAHSAASGAYQLPPGAMYNYPPSHSSTSRPSYTVQAPAGSKDDASATKHHQSVYAGQPAVLSQNSQRSE